MASYQIPQFLDSGDKIFLSMNLRQFGYALGFGFLAFLAYQISFTLFPQADWYNIIPALPFLAFGAYLALGKYNSRDAEIYVLAAILYLFKPRKMLYVRVPDIFDLEEKLATVTANNIALKMKERVDKTKKQTAYTDFDLQARDEKAKKILALAKFQDKIATETREQIAVSIINSDRIKKEIERKNLNLKNGQKSNALYEYSKNTYVPIPALKDPRLEKSNQNTRTYNELQSQNFFDEEQNK